MRDGVRQIPSFEEFLITEISAVSILRWFFKLVRMVMLLSRSLKARALWHEVDRRLDIERCAGDREESESTEKSSREMRACT